MKTGDVCSGFSGLHKPESTAQSYTPIFNGYRVKTPESRCDSIHDLPASSEVKTPEEKREPAPENIQTKSVSVIRIGPITRSTESAALYVGYSFAERLDLFAGSGICRHTVAQSPHLCRKLGAFLY